MSLMQFEVKQSAYCNRMLVVSKHGKTGPSVLVMQSHMF